MTISQCTQRSHIGIWVLLFALLSGCGSGDTTTGSNATATGVSFNNQSGALRTDGYRSVFGPERYVRGHGAPITRNASFPADNVAAVCKLVVHSGAASNKKSAVHSAVIRLNGTTVIGPRYFSGHTQIIERAVHLLARNTLSVELRSTPGSELVLEILCARQAGGAGTAIWNGFNWDDGSTWQ
ncbi:MAG: hypothetical protein FD165_1273 [Gammaproteobacteria bacterium]|nr:MAG: hypothetical protein FD165_1273 [Gammaproteobacteria bacterium]TND05772.1 MAG: hypothetical protein FD120_985 [Gammaproteobacteria bacterium]